MVENGIINVDWLIDEGTTYRQSPTDYMEPPEFDTWEGWDNSLSIEDENYSEYFMDINIDQG